MICTLIDIFIPFLSGFESAEPDRPQFQGLEITNPANGEPWTFFPSAESNKRKQLVMVSLNHLESQGRLYIYNRAGIQWEYFSINSRIQQCTHTLTTLTANDAIALNSHLHFLWAPVGRYIFQYRYRYRICGGHILSQVPADNSFPASSTHRHCGPNHI